ncbi:polysaccharide pyruvyl transferase family protein [Salinarimonas sp.]|uniref:polysaccharide pyruvyl transferase family protein n=1 Tax=Salinarimonas sp. TaxID=2766526 RepID=UPI00391C3718
MTATTVETDRGATIAYILLQTAFENVGDALINRQLIEILSRDVEVVIDVSRAPAPFLANLALDARAGITLRRGGLLALVREMIRARQAGKNVLFVLMPGGNRGEKRYDKYVMNRAYNRFLWLMTRFGVRIVQIGASYEALGPRYERLVRERARLMHRLIVRDRLSADYLSHLGVVSHGILPDLAFNLEVDYARLSTAPAPEFAKTIAFSFRTGRGFLSKDEVRDVVAATISAFPEARFKFVSQVESDAAFMKELAEDCRGRIGKAASHEDFSQQLDRYREVYGDCGLLISNRLHALLLGLSVGVQPLAVLRPAGDVKIRGVFESIGLKDRLLDAPVTPLDLSPFQHATIDAGSIADLRDTRRRLQDGIRALIAQSDASSGHNGEARG